jgi:hypothetical protein
MRSIVSPVFAVLFFASVFEGLAWSMASRTANISVSFVSCNGSVLLFVTKNLPPSVDATFATA